jgi:hypothetical protein
LKPETAFDLLWRYLELIRLIVAAEGAERGGHLALVHIELVAGGFTLLADDEFYFPFFHTLSFQSQAVFRAGAAVPRRIIDSAS